MKSLIRFVIVGICNTVIDLFLTNVAVAAFCPRSMLAYFLISLSSSFVAMLNSYFMNKYWTFSSTNSSKDEIIRFFGVTFAATLISASLFSFLVISISKRIDVAPVYIVNMAKIAAIGTSVVFNFLGMRFAVFGSAKVQEFKSSFSFPEPEKISLHTLGAVFCVSLFVRALFCFYTHSSLDGMFALASFCSSVCLPPLIYIYVSGMHSRAISFGVALALALHPRFIEYSCTYFEESFALFPLVLSLIGLQRKNFGLLLLSALVVIGTKNEYLFFFLPLSMFFFEKKWIPVGFLSSFFLFQFLYSQDVGVLRAYVKHVSNLAEKIPAAALSPLPLFALLLPVMVKKVTYPKELLMLLLFPCVYYCFATAYTNDLVALNIPLTIFGVLGLFALSSYVSKKPEKLFFITLGVLLLLLQSITIYKAVELINQ